MRTTHGPRFALAAAMTFLAAASIVAVAPSPPPSARPTLHVDPSLGDGSVRFAPAPTQGAFHRLAREFGGGAS